MAVRTAGGKLPATAWRTRSCRKNSDTPSLSSTTAAALALCRSCPMGGGEHDGQIVQPYPRPEDRDNFQEVALSVLQQVQLAQDRLAPRRGAAGLRRSLALAAVSVRPSMIRRPSWRASAVTIAMMWRGFPAATATTSRRLWEAGAPAVRRMSSAADAASSGPRARCWIPGALRAAGCRRWGPCASLPRPEGAVCRNGGPAGSAPRGWRSLPIGCRPAAGRRGCRRSNGARSAQRLR